MAHQRHADFLQDAGLHEAGVEGVAKIVEADVADTCVFQRGFPRALDDADRLAAETDVDTFGLALCKQQLTEAPGQGNLAAFSFRCFGTSDR